MIFGSFTSAPAAPSAGQSAQLARLPLPLRGWLSQAARWAIALVLAAVAWEALVVALAVKPQYVPRLSLILQAVVATPQPYVAGFLRTMAEALIGFVAGAVFGVSVGVLFHRRQLLREMVFPLFVISQTIPVIAFGALVVLWFGNTLMAKAIIAFYVTFFPVTVHALLGLKAVDPARIALMRSFGAGPHQLLWRLQLPSALPQIFVALRLAAALSLVGAIVGEWFGDTVGLGVLLLQAMFNENPVGLWAALLGCALLGTLFYGCVAALEKRIVFWGAEQ
ncbi:ABC transporter permease [Ramlibacter sp.]|uniref:ABC transporter permease n=1 Tax=Ramlibacter sp. TaxID=1917967 RepID=UPI002607ECD3|nr:ABC transporter permease [Ramlibacter sp.]MDB5953461.1 transporter permease [Ramlibacter sp.]